MQVTHSLVDCVALAIHTPLGVVLHTGDFKVDPTPTDNRLFDLHAFRRVRQRRRAGACCRIRPTSSAKATRRASARCGASLKKCSFAPKRRLFISCFSSSIHRIKLTVDMAREHGRKICFIGRSMNSSSEIAEDLGYLQIPEGMLIHPGEMKNYPARESVRPDQRHPGRADVGAVARRGRQS
jgi:ribonuclease J